MFRGWGQVHDNAIVAVEICGGNRFLFTGDWKGEIKQWDVGGRRLVRRIGAEVGLLGGVRRMQFVRFEEENYLFWCDAIGMNFRQYSLDKGVVQQ